MTKRDNFLEWLASTRLEKGKEGLQAVLPFELDPDRTTTESYERFYYTLPVSLLKLFQKRLDQNSNLFSEICTEIKLAAPCRDHSKQVGYWKTSGVRYDGFRLRSTQYVPEHVAMKKWPELENYGIKRVFVIDEAPATVSRDFKSYLGWLLTNKQFLDEHDELLSRNLRPIRHWGIEHGAYMPVTETIYSDPSQDPRNDPEWTKYNSEKLEFLYRWRLGGLAGPYLPTTLGAEVNPQLSRDEECEMRRIGSFLFVPDTVPIPSRDELRKMLQDARRNLPLAEHIREWQNVIRSESAARNQLQKYGRIFEIQHYWRALFQRHRKTLKGKTGDLESAFATWLKVSTETVHLDLITIRKRLGSGWLDRISPIWLNAASNPYTWLELLVPAFRFFGTSSPRERGYVIVGELRYRRADSAAHLRPVYSSDWHRCYEWFSSPVIEIMCEGFCRTARMADNDMRVAATVEEDVSKCK